MSIIAGISAPPQIRDFLATARTAVDAELDARLAIPDELAADDPERRLREAMRYAVLGGGKRLRPALVLAAARAIDPEVDAIAGAAAIELLHAYTLVHDDLPAMDDDDERRGRATVHVAYDEATAILAGDALLTVAFACLADFGPRAGAALRALTHAAGPGELLGGQARDLALETSDAPPTFEAVERVHRGKTGALFAAACELGAIDAAASADTIRRFRDYGMSIGVAFQHADDSDDGELAQFAEQARMRRAALASEALESIAPIGDAGALLADIARWFGGIGQ